MVLECAAMNVSFIFDLGSKSHDMVQCESQSSVKSLLS